jgi:hypothetical protein
MKFKRKDFKIIIDANNNPTEPNEELNDAVKNHSAKDKAKELVNKFNDHIEMVSDYRYELEFAKKRALICVDEMLEMSYSGYQYDSEIEVPFLEEVKQEITKL